MLFGSPNTNNLAPISEKYKGKTPGINLDNGNDQNEWGMQRGNSQRKDFYTMTSFTLLIRIGKQPNLCKYNTQ